MSEEELAQRALLVHVAFLRHEYTDWPNITRWPDGVNDGDLMRGEWTMPEERKPVDVSFWLTIAVYVVIVVLSIVIAKKLVAS